MKKSLVSLGAALATLLLASTGVRADGIPWSYIATPPPDIGAASPFSKISFAGSFGSASGNTGIIIYNLTLASTAPASAPDSFTSVPFNLSIALTDQLATTGKATGTVNASGAVNFSGLFSATNVTATSLLPTTLPGGPTGGVLWNSDPKNAASGSTPISANSASVILGSDGTGWSKYTVTLSSFTAPGPTAATPNPGSIQAIVAITPASSPGGSGEDPSAAPEPASLVLAGLGLPIVVLLRRRLKKDQVEATMV